MKDYDAIVRADWQRIDDEYLQPLLERAMTPEGLIYEGARLQVKQPLPPEEEAYRRKCHDDHREAMIDPNTSKEYLDAFGYAIPGEYDAKCDPLEILKYLYIDTGSGMVHTEFRDDIQQILKQLPYESVSDICKALMPVALDKLWLSGYAFGKLEKAREMLKTLNKIKKSTSSHIKNLPDSCPLVIKEPLVDGLETVAAYIRLLEEELKRSRYTASQGEYKDLTRHPMWNSVILNVVEHVGPAIKKSWMYEDSRIFSMTAKLLQAVYPWCWGHISLKTATGRVRDRCDSGNAAHR